MKYRLNDLNNACNDTLHRPLEVACSIDASVDVISTLLTNGADVNYEFPSGARALHLSVMMNNTEQVECLLKGAVFFSCADDFCFSLYMFVRLSLLILKKKKKKISGSANVNSLDDDKVSFLGQSVSICSCGQTALHLARFNENGETDFFIFEFLNFPVKKDI